MSVNAELDERLNAVAANGQGEDAKPQIPYVGDPIQLHYEHQDPRPGQIQAVHAGHGDSLIIDVVAWNPSTAAWHKISAVPHGPANGFPFWLYPGEEA